MRRTDVAQPGATLITEDELQRRVAELGAEISRDYASRGPLLVGVLKGAVPFMADLIRQIDVPCELDFMAVSSYGATTHSSGVVRIMKDLDMPLSGRDVIVVEDVIDSGLTLSYLMKNLAARDPASLAICTLLGKPGRRRLALDVNYVGFELPDVFVVGYGLDYAERFRNLPYIAELEGPEPSGAR